MAAILEMAHDPEDDSGSGPDEPTYGCVIALYPLAESKEGE
jgi:hypothetical protein